MSFTFQVDRVHRTTKPLVFFGNADLTGSSFELPAGTELVYKGLIELGGVPRYTFAAPESKAFTNDRQQLVDGLEERFDELARY